MNKNSAAIFELPNTKTMESEILTITPKMAEEMLAKNMKNNRKINHDTVDRYARIMKSGGWELTHQGIAFDIHGNLIDGQHRLLAIIAANEPVKMMVTYNVRHESDSVLAIDMGRKRTTQNIMQISGIEDPVYRNVAACVGAYIRNKLHIGRSQPEPTEIIAYIDRHYDDLYQLNEIFSIESSGCGRSSRIHATVKVAMLAALYRGEDIQGLKKFAQVYCRNDTSGCENYNPRHCLNLRDYIRGHKLSPESLQRSECAIYSFIHNQQVMRIVDRYPVNASLDS